MKKFKAIICAALCVVTLGACATSTEASPVNAAENQKLKSIYSNDHGNEEIIKDAETGVEYIVVRDEYAIAITPRIGFDGKPVTHK